MVRISLMLLLIPVILYLRVYRIDGNSMNYGLTNGDIVITTKRFDTIERGELFVIDHPDDPEGRLYVKRCTATPSDKFFEKERIFYLQLEGNATLTKQVAQTYLLPYIQTEKGSFLKEPYGKYYGISHDLRLMVPKELKELPLQSVPENHYMMMGDFRDNSADSRFFGAVPQKWIHSKVILILKKPKSWKKLLEIKVADETSD